MLRTGLTERGLSAVGLLIGLAALAAALTLILRLGPHYIDWQTMKSVFGELPGTKVHTMQKEEIRESLQKRFRVNSLREFDLREILSIERQKGETTLVVEYERREPIVANVDVVLSFSERYQFN
jgi:hypothetical protein